MHQKAWTHQNNIAECILCLTKKVKAEYYSNSYACNSCSKSKTVDDDGIWHCNTCNYDLCPDCVEWKFLINFISIKSIQQYTFMHYQSLDKKGKSMFIEPWLYPKMPFTLLAYELLRKDWIFSRSLLRLRSFELIFIPMVSLESFLTCKMIFILVNLATEFLMVSREMDSMWEQMR